jgi:cyclic pyranopterin phosphate synthase
MVDVGEKVESRRRAVAEATVFVGVRAARAVRENAVAKGNVLEIARIAGIQAAKRTHELVPLCHPLPLDHIGVQCRLVGSEVRIVAEASVFARTGVEMEAMTAASVAALTVYDMLKAVEKSIEIRSIHLLEKTGGRSGAYTRSAPEP